jgi:hypothetical protein
MSPPKRGRPPLPAIDAPTRLHLTLSSRAYDRAYALAQRKGISVPELLRQSLARALGAKPARE